MHLNCNKATSSTGDNNSVSKKRKRTKDHDVIEDYSDPLDYSVKPNFTKSVIVESSNKFQLPSITMSMYNPKFESWASSEDSCKQALDLSMPARR